MATSAAFSKTFDWRVDSPQARAETFTAYHGETVKFNPIFVGLASNIVAEAIYYTTNGIASIEDGSADWFKTDGLVFHPTNDCGLASYRFFLRGIDPEGVNYTANGLLRMLPSPSFEPAVLPLPVETIDFSLIVPLNAPWPTFAELSAAATASTNYTDAAISGLSIRPLATNTYNLASNAGYYIAVRDLAVAFGATVTNDPYAVPPAPAPEPTPPTPEARRIALFLVDVNDAADGVYCGFELKASTNNFTHATATNEDVRLQFYAQSEIADTGEGATPGNSLGIDRMMLFTGTSAGTDDVRAWTRIPNTVEWSGKPMRMAVLVDASCLVRHPEDGGDWLSESNEELVWCYLRNRALSPPYEREGSTAHSLWRPIQPARWYSSLPEWAR